MAPRFPLAAIASLTDSELYHNAYYCQLRQQCTHLLEVLRTVLRQRRDLVPSLIHSPVANSDIIVPSVYQSTLPRSASSHTSSLGPSDSASKQGSLDYAVWLWQAVEKLLESVEQPAIRPQFLPKSVLWDYEDCNDPAQGVIAAEANECRPKMNLAIRRNDGTRISNREYVNIRRAADIICTQLLNHIKSDPSSAVLLATIHGLW
ncbi:hypothetical protein EI94DRAFT_359470 [Lactarius quietus]|nr:hypothetical protein EI94DRAFT_359470 [Lactarius quietus]